MGTHDFGLLHAEASGGLEADMHAPGSVQGSAQGNEGMPSVLSGGSSGLSSPLRESGHLESLLEVNSRVEAAMDRARAQLQAGTTSSFAFCPVLALQNCPSLCFSCLNCRQDFLCLPFVFLLSLLFLFFFLLFVLFLHLVFHCSCAFIAAIFATDCCALDCFVLLILCC